MSTATDTDSHKVITIAHGIELCVEKSAYLEHEDLVNDLIRQCKIAMLDRAAALSRVKECIEELAKIDFDDVDQIHPLVALSEIVGWTSNYRSHTIEDYRKAMIALVDTLDDGDLVDALDVAEHGMRRAEVQ